MRKRSTLRVGTGRNVASTSGINSPDDCLCRGRPPGHGVPHGPGGGSRRPGVCAGRRVEQLLHAAVFAQRLPAVDSLLRPSAVSPRQSDAPLLVSGPNSRKVSTNKQTCLFLVCQVANEPPPLWEVPSSCNHFTAEVFRSGLQKDPDRRASAEELRRKTTKALRAGWPTTV